MKFAVTIGSYGMPHFVDLQIASLRFVFGPDVPILVSDDLSSESERIKAIADSTRLCCYTVGDGRRNHFAGDLQAVINSLVFAQAQEADVAVKVSQRMIMCCQSIRESAEEYFADDNVWLALPGRLDPRQICGARGFAHYRVITDVLFMRCSRIDPAWLKERYESRWRNGKTSLDCFVEALFADLVDGELAEHHRVFDRLTKHRLNEPKKFHRRYMSTSKEYRVFAKALGLDGYYQTGEWRQLESFYNPRPRA